MEEKAGWRNKTKRRQEIETNKGGKRRKRNQVRLRENRKGDKDI